MAGQEGTTFGMDVVAEARTPGSGDGASQSHDKAVQEVLELTEKLTLVNEASVDQAGLVETQYQNMDMDERIGAGDEDSMYRGRSYQDSSDSLGTQEKMNMNPMEARILAEEIMMYLDETLNAAFLDRTGIPFENWTTAGVDNFSD